ncbi:MAG TPA: orotate phosphoribosyltransferase [Burkholderiaceae bacterium]|nr:orotate phosphoribosyltransferase [Burkholderiaceae bacterium]
MSDFRQRFIAFALRNGVLRFGEFTTKAGRLSPYFFNAGLFNSGKALSEVAGFYADTLLNAETRHGLRFDMLYGPAYKGITLASATAVALAARGRDVPFAFNRKEAKDHGEGGTVIGAPLQGRVVIVDDVISAGTSVRESVALIRAAGAEPVAVLLALDRMERGGNAVDVHALSAVQEVRNEFGLPVHAIATLDDLLAYLDASADPVLVEHRARVADYRARYGVRQDDVALLGNAP